MSHLVHDTLSAIQTKVLSFNAAQLRVIAASHKKTDRRDAFWIAKALASGMYPHTVCVPTGEIRELRALLTRRWMLQTERNRAQRAGEHYLGRSLKGYLETVSELEAPLAALDGATGPDPIGQSLPSALSTCPLDEIERQDHCVLEPQRPGRVVCDQQLATMLVEEGDGLRVILPGGDLLPGRARGVRTNQLDVTVHASAVRRMPVESLGVSGTLLD